MLLFTFERALSPPPQFAAEWLHGPGAGTSWTAHMLGLRVEHEVRAEGAASRLRLDVHTPHRAWIMARPLLRAVIRARSKRLAARMAQDWKSR